MCVCSLILVIVVVSALHHTSPEEIKETEGESHRGLKVNDMTVGGLLLHEFDDAINAKYCRRHTLRFASAVSSSSCVVLVCFIGFICRERGTRVNETRGRR